MQALTVRTNQEAFDAVIKHLRTLKKRAWDTVNGACAYVASDGTNCAIGAIVPNPELLSAAMVSLLVEKGEIDAGDVSLVLLAELQDLHDYALNWSTLGGWIGEKTARDLARSYGLDLSVIDATA